MDKIRFVAPMVRCVRTVAQAKKNQVITNNMFCIIINKKKKIINLCVAQFLGYFVFLPCCCDAMCFVLDVIVQMPPRVHLTTNKTILVRRKRQNILPNHQRQPSQTVRLGYGSCAKYIQCRCVVIGHILLRIHFFMFFFTYR